MVASFRKYLLIIPFFFVLNSLCSSNNQDENNPTGQKIDCKEDNPNIVKVITITPEKIWTNTRITLKKGYDIIIEIDDERALGEEEVDFSNPVPFAGKKAIIYKIGEEGIPQPVGKKAYITAGAEDENKNLFLGWNTREPLIKQVKNEKGEEIKEKPQPITATVKIFIPETDKVVRRVALYAPRNNFWTNETNPRFYWDPQDNAIRYIFQISDYPDFRRIVETVEISASGGQVNPISTIGGGVGQVQFNLQEGIYWWRVIAQINLGRSLNPVPVWTCWAHPFRLGVELGTPPQPAEIISPKKEDVFKVGDTINFEFTVQDDPSFVFWRIRHVVSECDQQPSINPTDPNSGNPTPWHVFQRRLGEGNLKELPKLIASYKYENLERGNHLFRIEVKDSSDTRGVSIRTTDYRISVECEKTQESQQGTTQTTSQQGTTQPPTGGGQ
jgi:hypothetical protein